MTPVATIFSLVEHPEAASRAATWLSSKWGIPAEAYRESIEATRPDAPVPQWYLICEDNDPTGAPIAGCGIIDNNFHDRLYESWGWEYLGDVRDDGGAPIRLYGADTLPPAGER